MDRHKVIVTSPPTVRVRAGEGRLYFTDHVDKQIVEVFLNASQLWDLAAALEVQLTGPPDVPTDSRGTPLDTIDDQMGDATP